MTFIEFFDKNSAENICACLAQAPQKVILLGGKHKLLKKYSERYEKIFSDRGQNIEFVCKSINHNNLQGVVSVLEEIVSENENCAIGLTGGDDLFLTAAGIVFERHKDKNIQLHRYNLRNNVVYDCDGDGNTIQIDHNTHLTVEENIRIYGGEVIYGDNGTAKWSMTEEFKNDIRDIWDVCRKNVRRWNQGKDAGIARALTEKGLISKTDNKTIYKSEQVRRCINKAGNALEMIVYLAATESTDDNGIPVYNDAMNGVCIDWDGSTDEYDTRNEIDVMLMHGLVPIFISCKNGSVSTDELYKLNTVSQRFGGRYAKKILVATALETLGESGKYLRSRAKDMNIRIIDNIQDMSYQQIKETVKNFWCS